jgi:hypothetical protein
VVSTIAWCWASCLRAVSDAQGELSWPGQVKRQFQSKSLDVSSLHLVQQLSERKYAQQSTGRCHTSSALINVLRLDATTDLPQRLFGSTINDVRITGIISSQPGKRATGKKRKKQRQVLDRFLAPSRCVVRSHVLWFVVTGSLRMFSRAFRRIQQARGMQMLPILPVGMLQRRQYLVDAGLIQDAWGSDDEPGQSN